MSILRHCPPKEAICHLLLFVSVMRPIPAVSRHIGSRSIFLMLSLHETVPAFCNCCLCRLPWVPLHLSFCCGECRGYSPWGIFCACVRIRAMMTLRCGVGKPGSNCSTT